MSGTAYRCPKCHKRLKFTSATMGGTTWTCPRCGVRVTIEDPTG